MTKPSYKIRFKALFVVLLVVLSLVGLVQLFPKKPTQNAAIKTLAYQFALKNTSSSYLNNVDFKVALPMPIAHNQQPDIKRPGEQGFYSATYNIAPYATKMVNFTLDVSKYNQAINAYDHNQNYLAEQPYIEVSNPTIQALAKQLKAETPELTAKNTYNWLINNVLSQSYSVESRGAAYTLNNKNGDCTEFAYLFLALARANGIPARGVRGLYVPQPSLLVNPMDYHDWAEFYDGDKWVLVDAQKHVFNKSYSHYLIVEWFTDVGQSSHRFSISNHQVNVSFL